MPLCSVQGLILSCNIITAAMIVLQVSCNVAYINNGKLNCSNFLTAISL